MLQVPNTGMYQIFYLYGTCILYYCILRSADPLKFGYFLTSDTQTVSQYQSISDFESPSNFQVKEKKLIQIGPETTKLCFN